MSLGLSIRGAAVLPADYRGGAGIVEEVVGLTRRTRLEYRGLGDTQNLGAAALIAVQDPDTGFFYALSLSELPVSAFAVTLPDGSTQPLSDAIAGRARIGRTAINSTSYAATPADVFLAVTGLSAPITITLPASSSVPPGQPIYVADETGTCAYDRLITVVGSGTDTIAGAPSVTMGSAYQKLAFHSNGAGLWTFA